MPAPIQWAVELEEAVQNALVTYLQSAAAGLLANPTTGQPGVAIYGDWPEPDVKLQMPSLSVMRVGEPDVTDLDPTVIGPPLLVSGNRYQYTYRIAQATLPLQLDIWASSKAMRSDTLARLRLALTASKDVTLASYFTSIGGAPALQDPVENSIVLQLGAPWANTLADYSFSYRVQHSESPNAAGAREWRATLRGEATYDITKVLTEASLSQIILKTNPTPDPTFKVEPGGTEFVMTITAAGGKTTQGN